MKSNSKIIYGFFLFVTIIVTFGIYVIFEFKDINKIEHELEEANKISQLALDFNVENFHTQLEIWEYAYQPNQERLDAFYNHKETLIGLLEKWRVEVYAEAKNENDEFHALHNKAKLDVGAIVSNFLLVEQDWENVLDAVGKQQTATLEGASQAEIEQLNVMTQAQINLNEELFDELEFNKKIDEFVDNQGVVITNLETEHKKIISDFVITQYVIIPIVIGVGLIFAFFISKSVTDAEVLISLKKQKNKLNAVNKELLEHNKKTTMQSAETFQRYVLQKNLTASNVELASEKKFSIQKEEFAAMVSHELRTPIFPIKMHCEMLKDPLMMGKLSADQFESVCQIELMANKLDLLTGDILDAQKLDMNQMKFAKKKFRLGEFFAKVQKELDSFDDRKNVPITINFNDEEIYTDPDRLTQVFTNLILNSLDFISDKSGKIQIDATSVNGDILFSVKDNGVGIELDKIPHLFRKFYQIDTSLKRKHGGTGLGLVICKGIIDGLGGNIWVESEIGKGTGFYFRIPKTETFDYIHGPRNPLLVEIINGQ